AIFGQHERMGLSQVVPSTILLKIKKAPVGGRLTFYKLPFAVRVALSKAIRMAGYPEPVQLKCHCLLLIKLKVFALKCDGAKLFAKVHFAVKLPRPHAGLRDEIQHDPLRQVTEKKINHFPGRERRLWLSHALELPALHAHGGR